MKNSIWTIFAAISLTLVACNSSPNTAQHQSTANPAAADPNSADASSRQPQEEPEAPPPPDAQYTLFCTEFSGDSHILDADQAKKRLREATSSQDWHVIHQENVSDLYFGYYKSFDDRTDIAEYTRARQDRAKVASMLNQDGAPLFSMVFFVPINSSDPPAPKEWDMANGKPGWYLQIGIYRDSPQRKQATIDAVRAARAMGIEAYYSHGPTASAVYVGVWPKDAIKQQQSDRASSNDPEEPLLVLDQPAPSLEGKDYYSKEGKKMKVVMPKLEILDPTLQAAIHKYPYTFINGEAMGRKAVSPDGKITVVPYPSVLIAVGPPTGGDDQQNNSEKTDTQSPSSPAIVEPDSPGVMPQ